MGGFVPIAPSPSNAPLRLRRRTYKTQSVVYVLTGAQRVRRCHHTIEDAELLVESLDQGRDAVARARAARHRVRGFLVTVEVDAFHEHRNIFGQGGDQHFFRARLDVFLLCCERTNLVITTVVPFVVQVHSSVA